MRESLCMVRVGLAQEDDWLRWCDGAMVRWCDGAMVRWCDGAMVRW
jgi:hypothetical protein